MMQPQDIAQRVQRMINDRLLASAPPTPRVVPAEARLHSGEVDWYWIPVEIQRVPGAMERVYFTFSTIEEELEENESLFVLLVPRIIPEASSMQESA